MAQPQEKIIESLADSQGNATTPPIVIVGNGPIGMRAAHEALQRLPDRNVVIYGDEQHEPYNRVRLSSWLAGEVDRDSLSQPLRVPFGTAVEERIGYRVVAIDRTAKTLTDNSGRIQPYDSLILATGSRPFIPNIPGVDRSGVFTFRDIDDTSRLMARRASSHRTVVLGGGLLGLEAARGMQRGNTRVTVIEHADRLLGRQLDEAASEQLQADVEALGIDVIIGDGVAEVLGGSRVEGVRLRSGKTIPCDTLIVSTGIRSNIQLAVDTKLAYGRGIHVNDAMRTSDPDIYAVGECAEHRGAVYGLVAPGLEQAAVAIAAIADQPGRYTGSVAASRLKVAGTHVFSMGPMGAGENDRYGRVYVYRDANAGIYRKLRVSRNRLVGAIGIGDWTETVRLQTAITQNDLVWPWQLLRFLRTGKLWPAEDSEGVAAWPAATIVCQCTCVTRGQISEAIALGACSAEDISKATGASSVCGSCRPLVQEVLGTPATASAVPRHRLLLGLGATGLVAALLFFLSPNIGYSTTALHDWHWDVLWRDGLIKQITGFTILGLFAVGLLVSLRKRIKSFSRLGKYDGWRFAHVVLGLLVTIGLIAHTGFRFGHGLNFWLMLSFTLMTLIGTASAVIIALEHRIGGALAQRLRRQSIYLHVLLFWPVPALLGWHITKVYWY